jgi:hypothetical protein
MFTCGLSLGRLIQYNYPFAGRGILGRLERTQNALFKCLECTDFGLRSQGSPCYNRSQYFLLCL